MSEFLLVIALLLLILCMGLPVAFSLGATSVALIFLFGLPLKVVGATMFSSLDSFTTLSKKTPQKIEIKLANKDV